MTCFMDTGRKQGEYLESQKVDCPEWPAGTDGTAQQVGQAVYEVVADIIGGAVNIDVDIRCLSHVLSVEHVRNNRHSKVAARWHVREGPEQH